MKSVQGSRSGADRRFVRPLLASLCVIIVTGLVLYGLAFDRTRTGASGTGLPAYQLPVSPVLPDSPKINLTQGGSAVRVLYAGGGLTAGALSTGPELSFRSLINQYIRHFQPVSETVVGGVELVTSQIGELVPASRFDIVIVELGTEDYRRGPAWGFSLDYENLLKNIRANSPDAGLICVGAWGSRAKTSRIDSIISDQCRASNGIFRRISEFHSNEDNRWVNQVSPLGGADNFFPNNAGHRVIADRVLTSFEPSS